MDPLISSGLLDAGGGWLLPEIVRDKKREEDSILGHVGRRAPLAVPVMVLIALDWGKYWMVGIPNIVKLTPRPLNALNFGAL